jgi:hypothetical protein
MLRALRLPLLLPGVLWAGLAWAQTAAAPPPAAAGRQAPAAVAAPASAARVAQFTPQGMVKGVRQVTARFATPMVSFGDPRTEAPFAVQCAAEGSGRWADPRHWVYDFSADLPAGLRCEFRLKPGLRDLEGRALGGESAFRFDTGGPAVRASYPEEGSQALDERQTFILALDGEADAATVARAAWCEVQGLQEKLPVQVLEGAERAALLAQRRQLGRQYFSLLWKRDRVVTHHREADEKLLQAAEARLLVLRCQRPLPPETPVQLVWGAGIAAPSGVATTAEQRLAFRTRPAFTVRLECERVNARRPCLPMRPLSAVFSSPVPAAQALQLRVTEPGGRVHAPKPPEGAPQMLDSVSFPGPFPEQAKLRLELPAGLLDDAGRGPANAARFPLEFATDEYPPLAKFSGDFGIIEWREGGVLPVTLRNVEDGVPGARLPGISGAKRRLDSDAEARDWLQRVRRAVETRGDWEEVTNDQGQPASRWKERTGDASVFGPQDAAEAFTLPKPGGGRAFEVVGIPLGSPGLHVVELASPRLGAALLGEPKPRYVPAAALVTDLAVHFKWGREDSLVWVTRLSDGAPAAGADIAISSYKGGQEYWRGRSDASGIARVPAGVLPTRAALCCDHLFVSARLEGDFSFAESDWENGIAPQAFSLPTVWSADPYTAHSVLDRALFRAGETVSMTHYFRQRTAAGFAVPQARPARLRLEHQGSGQKYEFELRFDDRGLAESAWEIPKEAKLGQYQIRLGGPFEGQERWWDAGSFRVEQFRLPTMRAIVQPPKEPLIAPPEVPLDLHLSYLNGGAAGGAAVTLRTVLEPRELRFKDYEDYRFGGEPVRAGPVAPGEEQGFFEMFMGREPGAQGQPARVQPLTLDAAGAARTRVPLEAPLRQAQDLVAEMEYADANGERLTAASRIPLWTAGLHVGVRAESGREALRFRLLALDLQGRPLVGQAVRAELFQRLTTSYRKRLAGGFYSYEHQTEHKALPQSCVGRTDDKGLLHCEIKAPVSGEILIQARAADAAGREAVTVESAWLYAAGEDTWFEAGDHHRMDLIPERSRYESGDTARLQVRMPFRKARALVTVEREGVMEAFVTELKGEHPVVELPVGTAHAPNVFVSVLALRGRVGGFQSWAADMLRQFGLPWKLEGGRPTALADLSRPAFRLGLAKLNVGWAPHRLEVSVRPERGTYGIRERARVRVQVKPAQGGPPPHDAEIAFAAVDEALLELKPNESWKLLERMLNPRALEVYTATAQMQVVGKRNTGRKAVPQGGGGGRQSAREVFDTLLLWKGRVPLDAQGEADIEVPLNDALTSFRLVAVASAGAGQFGTGQASIRSTQDLMLLSGLAPLVRAGDRYQSVFTVRNGSTRDMTVELRADVAAGPAAAPPALEPRSLALKAGAAAEVVWELTAPPDAGELRWTVSAQEQGGKAADRMALTQPVQAALPVRVFQATLQQLDKPLQMSAAPPAGAEPGRGGLRVNLRARLGDGLEGVVDYMRAYPFTCLEQQLSRGVALGDDSVLQRLDGYLDRDGLLKFFASMPLGDDTLTSYVLSITHEAGWSLPEGVRERMLQGLEGFVTGRVARDSALPTADLALRKLRAIAALARHGRAKPALLGSLSLEPQLWPTSALLDWLYVLRHALPHSAERSRRLEEAQGLLRARLNFQGSTLTFSTERSDALWWLLVSADENAVRALLQVLDEPAWREDVPRLVTGALGRMRAGRWSTTLANAWGMLAMRKFSAAFEQQAVAGRSVADYAGQAQETAWPQPEAQFDFPWPASAAPQPVATQPGATAPPLSLRHEGSGKPWALLQSRAALPLREPLFSGYRIVRRVTPVEQKTPGVWSRGDVARITLEMEAQSDMTWVVVEDPVPAGASILGSGLGRDASLRAAGETESGHAWPAYQERRFDSYRAYYQWVPKGRWTLEYTLRFNSAGQFRLPPTRVEAMYAPEMFGELPNADVSVQSENRL